MDELVVMVEITAMWHQACRRNHRLVHCEQLCTRNSVRSSYHSAWQVSVCGRGWGWGGNGYIICRCTHKVMEGAGPSW